MARAPAKAEAKPPRGAAKQGSLLWLAGLGCGALMTLATPTAVVAGILLAPGLLSVVMDQSPGKPTARSVILFGLAATVPPLAALWRTGHHMGTALDLAGDSTVLATAWAAQGGAWLLCELTPLIVTLVMEAVSRSRAARLRAARAGYEEQWGLPPEGQEVDEE
jgi:hypothetical protein